MTLIVHATDLSSGDHHAFVHAVALARGTKASLVSLHANDDADSVRRMPLPAGLLEAWGDDPNAVAFERKVHNCCDDPVDTLLDGIGKLSPDLIVAATHRRSALSRFFVSSSAEAIAHNAKMPVLLLPEGARSLVRDDGRLNLRRILVPIGDANEAAVAIRTAAWLADLADADEVEFVILHVGEPMDVDVSALSARPGWTLWRVDVPGHEVEEAILEQARSACLVVMATRGHDSLVNVFRGSHTDRVVHESRCPVLSIGVQP